jgi:hypothetical protein
MKRVAAKKVVKKSSDFVDKIKAEDDRVKGLKYEKGMLGASVPMVQKRVDTAFKNYSNVLDYGATPANSAKKAGPTKAYKAAELDQYNLNAARQRNEFNLRGKK